MKQFSHTDLVEIGRKWLLTPRRQAGRGSCSLVLTEIATCISETPDVIGWYQRQSIVLEAKASLSDFYSDRKKHFRAYPQDGLGCLRYYIVPKYLIKPDQLPDGWGLIEVSETKTQVTRESQIFISNRVNEIAILLSLIRRLKIEPGKHISIRAYSHLVSNPRTTVTVHEEG